MNDYYDEGYGAGIVACDWKDVVMGRFLTQPERKALADGWKAGNRDREAWLNEPVSSAAVPGDEIPW